MWNTWQLKKEFMFACFPLIYFSKPDQYAVSPFPSQLSLTALTKWNIGAARKCTQQEKSPKDDGNDENMHKAGTFCYHVWTIKQQEGSSSRQSPS